MALTPDQLAGAGLQPYNQDAMPPPVMPDMRLAEGGGGGAVQGLPPITGVVDAPVAPMQAPTVAPKQLPGEQPAAAPTKVLIKATPAVGAPPEQTAAPEVNPRNRELDELVQGAVKRKLRGGGAVRTVPEHQQETTGKVKRQAGPSPAAMEAVSDAEIDYQLQKQSEAESVAAGMEPAANRMAGDVAQQRYQLDMDQFRRQLIDRDIEDRQKGIDEREQHIAQMASNPQSFFQSHGALASAAVVIGSALGAAGASLAHTPNFAQEIMQKAVDDEFRAQEAAIVHAKNGTEAERWSLAQFVKAHGDPYTAEQEFKLRAKDLIEKMAETEAVRSGAPGVMAAFQDWKAQRDLERAKEVASLDASVRGEVEQNWKTIPKQTTGGGADLLSALQYGAKVRKAGEEAFGVIPATEQAKLGLERQKVEGEWGKPGATGGNPALTPLERELGMSTPAKRGSPVGAQLTKANQTLEASAKAVRLADAYEQANLHANDNLSSWDAKKRAEKITEEARGTFMTSILESTSDSAKEQAEKQLPIGGAHLLPWNLTTPAAITEAAAAMREKALDNFNSSRAALGLQPVSMEDFRTNYTSGAQTGAKQEGKVETFQEDK